MSFNKKRNAPLEMSPDEFRSAGHRLVDQIADFLSELPNKPVTTGKSPAEIRKMLGADAMPEEGEKAEKLLENTASLLFDHSLFNGHPKFLGYITSSAAPIGALAEMLAASVNPNVGAYILSPVATEIERQAISWIAEMIGYPADCGGILSSGGNMANFIGFLAARRAKSDWDIRRGGFRSEDASKMCVYVSAETHTWIQKAADMFGLGTQAIRWIETDEELLMDASKLRQAIQNDLRNGFLPFMVVGTGGSVSTGAIDPLPEIAEICREFNLWFHVDGAYGAFAAALPDAPENLLGLRLADSIALDPHKWLYAPLEAGCTLVRDPQYLRNAFTYRPPYYKFDDLDGESQLIYNEFGPQNSRGFRALKVWLGLRQAGRNGYERMLSDDIELARELFQLAKKNPELEAMTLNLSITTFRYVPKGFEISSEAGEAYLNKLNTEILTRMQVEGEAFVSNAVIFGKYALRSCVVNFRTTSEDIAALPGIVTKLGREIDQKMRN